MTLPKISSLLTFVALVGLGCGMPPTGEDGGTGGSSSGTGGGTAATGGGSSASGGGTAATGGGTSTGGGTDTGGGSASGGGAATTGGGATGGGSAITGGGAATGGGSAGGGSAGGGTSDGGCPYLYCEDFEGFSGPVAQNQILGKWKATVQGDAGVSIDGWQVSSGTKAFHVWMPAGPYARGTLNRRDAGGLVPGDNMFGRVHIYYSNANDAGLPIGLRNDAGMLMGAHSWIFNSNGLTDDGGWASMNMGGGGAKMQLNYHPPAPAPEQGVQGGMMTTGSWHCLQWQYDSSATAHRNEARVWVDGTLAITVDGGKGWDLPSWTSIDLGFTHYQTLGNPVEIAVDDFALNGSMIPCQ